MRLVSGADQAILDSMIRYQFRGCRLLFVGINPHHGSYRRGVPFSNNKLFWYLLNRAGLIREEMADLRDDDRLRAVYRGRFNRVYRLGLVNVINRPTRDITELKRGEEKAGRRRIAEIIRTEKPVVVCFIGKVAYEKFSGLRDFGFGWQEDIFCSRAFVMHFPQRGRAEVRVEELRTVAQAAQLDREKESSGG